MVPEHLNGLFVFERAQVEGWPPVRVRAEKLLVRERGNLYRLVGGNPVYVRDIPVVQQQDVQDRGVGEPVMLPGQ